MKVAAFGRTKWLYDRIKMIIDQGHEIVLIGACKASPEYTVNEHDFVQLANEIGCPFFCDSAINKSQYIEMIKQSQAEVAISVNWLTIIKQQFLDQFHYGVINAHAGDLPRFRGNACANWAILNSFFFVCDIY